MITPRHPYPPMIPLAALVTLCAALAAWPSIVHAQGDAASGTSASANGQRSSASGESALTAAARRARADEQRLLGSPGASHNPYGGGGAYSSDGASPEGQEKALTTESRMHIVSPTDFYATGTGASGGAVRGTGSGASSRARGASAMNGASAGRSSTHSRITHARPDNAASGAQGGGWAAYDWGASTTSPTAKIYGNPYGSQRAAAAQLYRSPW
ncbi:hypothetical protein [Paraburkholderia sp.]|uniref:hypothetical protein n=1 Tax=Paraburkholderia sp. TaxID=1926495 RepID=UPI00286EE649|nr:hypothetical protein [Paraburkholderia sp.]